MGIKHLNQFLKQNCSQKSIHRIHLRSLKGKTVVIDTSIYLYKFIARNALVEHFTIFLSLFKKYGITPIFIFDGKPPPEKKQLLIQRLLEKREAETKYQLLAETLDAVPSNAEKNQIEIEMEHLKKQFIRVQPEQIQEIKKLFEQNMIVYEDAPSEADELCAEYLRTGKAWACISDDMDMLVYENTTNIIRNFNIWKHTAYLYNKPAILMDLEMCEEDFNKIMILSGTDYNIKSNTSLKETIRWYYQYNKYRCDYAAPKDDFYTWLHKNTKYITNYNHLLQIENMFRL
jgi:flap endonuclease-1